MNVGLTGHLRRQFSHCNVKNCILVHFYDRQKFPFQRPLASTDHQGGSRCYNCHGYWSVTVIPGKRRCHGDGDDGGALKTVAGGGRVFSSNNRLSNVQVSLTREYSTSARHVINNNFRFLVELQVQVQHEVCDVQKRVNDVGYNSHLQTTSNNKLTYSKKLLLRLLSCFLNVVVSVTSCNWSESRDHQLVRLCELPSLSSTSTRGICTKTTREIVWIHPAQNTLRYQPVLNT